MSDDIEDVRCPTCAVVMPPQSLATGFIVMRYRNYAQVIV